MSNDIQKPAYFAILPSTVRYDKRLKAIERIFFAEITALSNKNGFCTASNSYFAKVFEINKTTASRYISNLAKYNYIYSEVERDENNRVIMRRIYPKMDAQNIPINSLPNSIDQTINTPIVQTDNTPIDQTSKYNNTSINNTSNNIRESENSDYIDFNSLLSQGAKIGLIGQAKAILQTELNCLVFDDFDNKVIQRMLNSIKSNLKAFKQKKGDYSSVTTKNVIDAFKTSVNAVKSNSKQESISLNYLNSCLTADLYINADKKKVQNDDLSIYQDVVKQTFKHYNRFTAFDKAKLREIIAAIEEAGAEDVYAEFKSLFANLPAYILNSRSYQSVSFVASKINDLMNITSTDAQIKSYHNYTLLKESYGEDRAREMISKILKKKQNEGSKVH